MMDGIGINHGWGMSGGMWFWTILFWIVVILGIVYIVGQVRSPKSNSTSPPPPETPRSILDARYARGEIDEDTYKRMKEQLEDTNS